MRRRFDFKLDTFSAPTKRSAWRIQSFIVVIFTFLTAVTGTALPIGFGRNQGPLTYDELISNHFHVYFDHRVPHEAKGVMATLELSRPYLENWLQVSRSRPLPVVMSAATSNASFANFITDAVELQTLGFGGRDLAIHEYVHSTMYRKLDNIFGPAGSIIHLPWMPAWWIEGLAESLAISVQSDVQMAYERYQAVTGDFPSYDKLHSLYLNREGDFAERGYATAGAFVSYLLRTYDAAKLPGVLDDFYHLSMPWQWPKTVIPFLDFMPMDEALRRWTQKSGRELYDEYKAAAAGYWQPRTAEQGGFLFTCAHGCAFGGGSSGLQARDGRLFRFVHDNGDFREDVIDFKDRENGVFAQGVSLGSTSETFTRARILKDNLRLFVRRKVEADSLTRDEIVRQLDNGAFKRILSRKGMILQLFDGGQSLYWLEHDTENTRLCFLPDAYQTKPNLKAVTCPLTFVQPTSAEVIGESGAGKNSHARHIWLRVSTETPYGDRHRILRYDIDTKRTTTLTLSLGGRPLSLVENGAASSAWLLMAGRSERFLRKIDGAGTCLEERTMTDFPAEMYGVSGGDLVLFFSFEKNDRFVQISPDRFKQRACAPTLDHFSPMMYAYDKGDGVTLGEALQRGSPRSVWTPEEIVAMRARIENASAMDALDVDGAASEPHAAHMRGRPIFAFPWIGADARGYQVGVLSVPWMDEMQNETLQASVMYGPGSRFTQTELGLTTNRFSSAYTVALFRHQRYNGSAEGKLMYYDEKGGSLKMSSYCHAIDASCDMGVASSTLTPLYGPPGFKRSGHNNELQFSLDKVGRIKRATLSGNVFFNVAPAAINKSWVYNQTGGAVSLSHPFSLWERTSTLSGGFSASATRGKKRRFLKEVYRPLTTFVPGAGSDLNEINEPFLGPGLLTSARFGENQAKAKLSWTIPVVYDLEKLIGIFYFERLDFSAFFNYGTAWNNFDSLTKDDMVAAHGYHLDLKSDIKGVTVNLGLGAGQVIGYAFEAYFMLGFNTLIDH